MIPRKYAPLVFGAILSGVMSLLVSGVAVLRSAGPVAEFLALWIQAWLPAWAIALPVVLVAAPATRRLVDRLTRPAAS